MPDSFQSIAVLVLALLPGALYVWSFERQAGRWGIGLSDRILRFVGGSAIFHAVGAPLTYWLWAEHQGRLRSAEPLSWWLWLAVIGYVSLPVAGGTLVGRGLRMGQR